MRRFLVFTLFFIFLCNSLFALLIELKNEYIKIIGDPDSGRFIIKTIEGDPQLDTDNNSLLLYEDYPPTSFTTIRIDGIDYKFGDEEMGEFVTRMVNRNNVLTTVWSVNNIEVTQKLRFVLGPTTGREDTVEISYRVVNKCHRPHKIGIRIMLDTYLGKEDGAPFRIPGIGNVTTETQFVKDKIPIYWYSFDDIGEPSVRSQGTLIIPNTTPPDKVIFASWGRLNKYYWDFKVSPGRSFKRSFIGPQDSAVAIYWNPVELKPNESRKVVTYYGLYGGTLYKGKIFNISVGAPLNIQDEPVIITAEVQNISPYKVKNVTCSLTLPDGLALSGESKATTSLANMDVKEVKKTFWEIRATGSKKGELEFIVTVAGYVKGKKVEESVRRKINANPTREFVTYDFSKINALIDGLKQVIQNYNTTIDEINNLLKAEKKVYPEETKERHVEIINEGDKKTEELGNGIDEAIKSIIKKSKK